MPHNLFRGPHLDDEELTCFIDGTCIASDRERIAKHLRTCSRCAEVYRDAVLYKGLWASGASDLDSSEESIELGLQMTDTGNVRNPIKPERTIPLSSRYLRMIAIAASIVIIAAFGISNYLDNMGMIHMLDQDHIVPIREAVEMASMRGHMVIPGGERSIDSETEAYRSGYIRINDSLRTAFAYLAGEFQKDRISRGVVYWLLGGYIATGQVSAARDIASQATQEFPGDIDMMVFDAIVYYMEGDLVTSERIFRHVLETEPENPYANLNLAVLLYERGEEFEALRILERVESENSDSPFAARAGIIREEIIGSNDTDL
jgi:tetratricopeptide (TPR) repeat protein